MANCNDGQGVGFCVYGFVTAPLKSDDSATTSMDMEIRATKPTPLTVFDEL